MDDRWAGLGSALASIMFVWAIARQYFPALFNNYVANHATKLLTHVYPYILITFPEYTGDRMQRSSAYSAIESYLTATCSQTANKLKAELCKDNDNLVLSMDDNQEVEDNFLDAKLWWSSTKSTRRTQAVSFFPTPEEHRSYKLTFHKSHRGLVTNSYLAHVMKEGREVRIRNRQRKLYTNNAASKGYGRSGGAWSHVMFEHPASFQTVAMPPTKKKEIMLDLDAFRKRKDYYARIGKAWKRGYLLYGPPGTGKSSIIAAMANYMEYDVYDLELTTVNTNTDLRKLFIETTSKSIIVLEDIDCSLDLTGKRKRNPKAENSGGEDVPVPPTEEKDESSKVTLSGLLNFIDGLWSACGGERIIIFTTNHLEKLDPALIRRGRMDMHIEMGYCGFEAFKVLAHNYLELDSHHLFETIEKMLGEINITPADVAENLMPKFLDENAETCLADVAENLMPKSLDENAEKSLDENAETCLADVAENLLPKSLDENAEKSLDENAETCLADVAENLMPKSLDEIAETCLRNLIKAMKKSKKEEIQVVEKCEEEEPPVGVTNQKQEIMENDSSDQ